MKILFVFVLFYSSLFTSRAFADPSEIKALVDSEFSNLVKASENHPTPYKSFIVGVVTQDSFFEYSYGETSELGRPLNSLDIFEIASITKGFVGLAASEAELDKRIDCSAAFSAEGISDLPDYGHTSISWRNLLQHTSGLGPFLTY